MPRLVVRFAVPIQERQRAEQLLQPGGHQLLDVEQAGAQFDLHGVPSAVLVVRSAQDFPDLTPGLEQQFAKTIGNLFEAGGIDLWQLAARPGYDHAKALRWKLTRSLANSTREAASAALEDPAADHFGHARSSALENADAREREMLGRITWDDVRRLIYE